MHVIRPSYAFVLEQLWSPARWLSKLPEFLCETEIQQVTEKPRINVDPENVVCID